MVPLEHAHKVYWGSHGCKKRRGHANPCVCVCGDVYAGTYYVYGNDKETAVAKP